MKVCPCCAYYFDKEDWLCPSCGFIPKNIDGFLAFSPELATENEGFDANAFSQLFSLESKNFWFRARNKLVLYLIRRYFSSTTSYLEIGCGTGFVMQDVESTFPNFQCFASEIYTEGLKYANQRLHRTTLLQMDARKIPFVEEFDLIGAFDVLEHIEEDSLVLSEIYRALKHGGGAIITVPQHPWLWSQDDVYAKHKRRYTRKELLLKLKQVGFRVVRITSFVSLLLPLMVISRMGVKASTNYDPGRELNVGGLLNFLLERILDVERLFIECGINFPMGGSLVVVARKLS